jgi:hypothetical protein
MASSAALVLVLSALAGCGTGGTVGGGSDVALTSTRADPRDAATKGGFDAKRIDLDAKRKVMDDTMADAVERNTIEPTEFR